MKWFKKQEPIDPLKTAKSRQEIIERLEDMGYLVRARRIRRPKVGDTVRFRVGAGWKINTHYYRTGVVQDIDEYGNVHVVGEKFDHTAHPYTIVKVSKTRVTTRTK